MKLGKIYDYRNKEEAKKLIGKRVLATDFLCRLENPAEGACIGIFTEFKDRKEFPFRVVISSSSVGWSSYQFIREIVEEEDEPKLMTNRQLAEWCIKCGMARHKEIVFGRWDYRIEDEDDCVEDDTLIRPIGSNEWVKPTLDIYERDCKGIRKIE